MHGDLAAVDGAGAVVPLVRIEAAERRAVVDPHRWWTPRHATRLLAPHEPSPIDAFGYVLFVYTVGQVLLRRERLAHIGEFDPILRVAQDYDLWLRISARGRWRTCPSWCSTTARPIARSRRTSDHRREDLYARFKCITDRSLPLATRRLVRHLHRHHEWHRSAERLTYIGPAFRRRELPQRRARSGAGRSLGG